MEKYIREPINSLTHLVGVFLSIAALVVMIVKVATSTGGGKSLAAVIVFGISLILLYTASTTYHWVIAKNKVIAFLRKIDHSMIFVLIAGTYAPFCLVGLDRKLGWTLFGIITGLGLAGVVFKMVWFNCPRWLSTALYIGMGWIAVTVISPLSKTINIGGVVLLILGGVIYTIGGVIYAVKPKFLEFKWMGFHEIFHLFILLGSVMHFLSVYLYVL
ncbi:PAQR family membrane homeostasis protein TrhA [Bacillus andreraoultii]|uniref:PAQR family membrane homeostasis protein TrhA n=1 Tax=Bacillus andreraoultii TaxID=1499685 RepID=UPI0005396A8C|nr:hemolysin III family protein [Bacillus andreraoultii]